MASGGKREGVGRKPIDDSSKTLRFSIRISEKTLIDIEKFGVGNNNAERMRDLIEKGIQFSKENQEK